MFFYVFRLYLRSEHTRRVGMGGDESDEPKRRVSRCLGYMYVFFFPSFFIVLTKVFSSYIGSIYIIKPREGFGWAAMRITRAK
jgi:hypothetical protein